MLHRVTRCYTVLKGAKRWHMMFHGVTGFSRVWVHGVTGCFIVLYGVKGCFMVVIK